MEEQDVYRKMLSKIGLKRIPIILMPIALPFFLVIISFVIVLFVGIWITMYILIALGFWQCNYCKKIHWANTDRKRMRNLEEYKIQRVWKCEHCQLLEELTEKD